MTTISDLPVERPDALPALRRLLDDLGIDPINVRAAGVRVVTIIDGSQTLEVDVIQRDDDDVPTGLYDTVRYPVGDLAN